MGKRWNKGVRDRFAHDDAHTSEETRTELGRPPRVDYRDAQLAKIAARVIETEIASRSRAIEWGLHVADVEIIGGGAHVRAWLTADNDAPRKDIEPWLELAATWARAALARELNKKRTAAVSLLLVPRSLDTAPPPKGTWS